eukprot:876527-Prymnesium_polylepis.1
MLPLHARLRTTTDLIPKRPLVLRRRPPVCPQQRDPIGGDFEVARLRRVARRLTHRLDAHRVARVAHLPRPRLLPLSGVEEGPLPAAVCELQLGRERDTLPPEGAVEEGVGARRDVLPRLDDLRRAHAVLDGHPTAAPVGRHAQR